MQWTVEMLSCLWGQEELFKSFSRRNSADKFGRCYLSSLIRRINIQSFEDFKANKKCEVLGTNACISVIVDIYIYIDINIHFLALNDTKFWILNLFFLQHWFHQLEDQRLPAITDLDIRSWYKIAYDKTTKKQCEKMWKWAITASAERNTSVVSKGCFSWDTRAVLHITTSCHDPACKNTRAV